MTCFSIIKKIVPLSAILLCFTACSQQVINQPNQLSSDGTSINGGGINTSIAYQDTKLPSLGEIRSLHKTGGDGLSEKQKAKYASIRDEALSYGLQAGLYEGTRQIDRRLNAHAAELSKIYNFNHYLIRDKSGQLLLPPVITEQDEMYNSEDGGKTISIADKMYTIEKNVTFAPTSPLWHSYLFRSFQKAVMPDNNKLPSNKSEQAVWAKYVTEGYDRGMRQSVDIFKQDMRQLQHDFGGMVRYYSLLEEHKISAPYVVETNLGITGTEDKAVYNNRILKIMDSPKLNVDTPSKITSITSTKTPDDAIGVSSPENPYDRMDQKGWQEVNPDNNK